MQGKLQIQLAFHLTGTINGGGLQRITEGLVPALFSRISDLAELRYDLPMVLNTIGSPERSLLSLSHMVDEVVCRLADTPECDRIARHGYRIESEIRRSLATAGESTLSDSWKSAAESLSGGDGDLILDSAWVLESEFFAAGSVTDLDRDTPALVMRHIWRALNEQRTASFRNRIDRLLYKLHNILDAETVGSAIGRSPDRLRASVGSAFDSAFNFDALSNILSAAKPETTISDRRRERIKWLIDVLERQQFYAGRDEKGDSYCFIFERPSDALKAHNERYPAAVELAKALAVAELEAAGEYREGLHDPIFEFFGSNGLTSSDREQLPSYLICTDAGSLDPAETSKLLEILAVGLPFKVLVRTDDVLEPSELAEGHLSLGLRARQLVDTAIGLTDVFVFQAAASSIFRCRSKLISGLSFAGPALFSVFSGDTRTNGDTPAYLTAEAATESRVFPSLFYDPDGGSDRASRLSIENNPQPDVDWPAYSIDYEDESIRAHKIETAFTPVDLMVMDQRFSSHFALVPHEDWIDEMIPVPEVLAADMSPGDDKVPYVDLIDDDGILHRAIVDTRAIDEARRCLRIWQSLRESGRSDNPHNKPSSDLEVEVSIESDRASDASLSKSSNGSSAAEERPAGESKGVSVGDGSPYIESARCTSCNECTHINAKMFAYDDNKQAYIADPDAGTFRQLVEAAEGCQVSIIHPGVPRNPKEPGIEDLIVRAAAFN